MDKKSELTYVDHPEEGIVDLLIDGKCFTEWSYEENPEQAFNEFRRIFEAGYKAGYIADVY